MNKPTYEELEKRIRELEYAEAERKKAEEALRKNESRYKQLLNAITSYVYTVTVENGKPVKTSHGRRCEDVTGYTPGEFEAEPYLWINMVHREDRDAVKNQAVRMLSGESAPPLEHRIIRKDGKLRWVRNTPVPQYNTRRKLIAYDGVIEDITERKKAEEALRESEERYKQSIENSPNPIFSVDRQGKIQMWNTACEKIFQYDRDIAGETYKNILWNPEDPAFVDESIKKVFKGQSLGDLDITYKSKDGTIRNMVSRIYPLTDNEGKTIGCVFTNTDITRRKQMEDALIKERAKLVLKVKREKLLADIASRLNTTVSFKRISNEVLKTIASTLNISNVSLFSIDDKSSKIRRMGRGFRENASPPVKCFRALKFSSLPDELQGIIKNGVSFYSSNTAELDKKARQFFTERNIHAVLIIPIMIGEKFIGMICFCQNRVYTWTPEVRELCHTVADMIANAWERDYHFRARLEAEKKRTEAVKFAEQASRFASIGALAAGVAHEINQPLNVMRMSADMQLLEIKDNQELSKDEVIENLRLISKQIDNIDGIIKHMRALARWDEKTDLIPVNLNTVIKKAIDLIGQQVFSHDINITLNLEGGIPLIKANASRMEQVVINLVINAMQSLDTHTKEDKKISISTRFEKGKCILEVQDNGPGISSDNLEHIFDPFFSTKNVGEGMGLGLSITKNIISGIGGAISAKNAPKGGAIFTVSIPVE